MNSYFIQHKHCRFHYQKFGTGNKLVFAFHGYGRDGSTFYFLENYLGQQYTIIAIDLPFHGLTEWDKDLTFHPSYLIQVMQEIRHKYTNQSKKFYLLGFSMGGRIAMQVGEILHKHVERMVLIAPDGLRINFWHWAGTHTWTGNKLLHHTVHHPAWFLQVVKLAEKSGAITKNIASFVHYYFDDEDQRILLFRRWTTMRKFYPKLSRLKKFIRQNNIKVKMLFGRSDKVILYGPGEKFIQGIEDLCAVEIINAGHNLLQEYNGKRIAQLFND